MDIRDGRGLRSAAGQALACAPNEKRYVLIWAGASAAVSLLVSFLSLVLEGRIAETGGLGGLGLRSVLSTVQSVLSMANSLGMPFWTLGYTFTMLQIARQRQTATASLLEGFRRFGPALRLMLLEGVLYTGLAMSCVYVGILLMAMTPLADPVYAVLSPILDTAQADPELVLSDATMEALTQAMMPMLTGCLVLYLAVLIPVSYRLRMAQYRILEDDRCGALMAMRDSFRLTRRSCIRLLRLDLGFWWFYLGQLVIGLLCYADVLLPMAGVALPMDSDTAFWLFYALALGLQVGFFYLARNRVSVTYALAYDSLRAADRNSFRPT